MVYYQGYFLVLIGLILSVIGKGNSLRCWKCSSELDATCRDHFNTTRILLNQKQMDLMSYGNLQPARNDPHLAQCDGMHTSTYSQFKEVCLKKVLSTPYGPNKVYRECRMVHKHLPVGACPEDIATDKPINLEFCGTCEYDGCNSSGTLSAMLVGLVPALILLLGK